MAKYRATIRLEDADGGTWDEQIEFEAASDRAAEEVAVSHAEEWFQPATEIGSGKSIPPATSASFDLMDLDTGEDVMQLELEADGNSSGQVFRE